MICRRSSLIDLRQSYHFKKNFDRVLLQLVDILNNHSVQIQRGQLTFITETFVVLTKMLRKVRFVITKYPGRDCYACSLKKLDFEV